MSFLEIFQVYILPAAGAVGGLAVLITFLLSKHERDAKIDKVQSEARKTDAERDEIIQRVSDEAVKQALIMQGIIMDNLQAQIKDMETELREARGTNMALEAKLRRYEAENERYRKENQELRKQVEAQRKRIQELENQIKEINRRYKDE